MSNKEKLIPVASYILLNEAEFARMILEDSGIQSKLFDKEIIGVDPWISNAVGGIKLKVKSQDVERAIEILRMKEIENKLNYKPWCPNCDSENVSKNELNRFLKILSILTLGIGTIVFAQSYKCNDCGYKWS